MIQGANTGSSAQANQAGSVAVSGGGTGSTWGKASYGADESSWTSSDVTAGLVFTTGTLTLNNNIMRAGGSTSALQSISMSGISGSASVGSTDRPFYTQAGAGFISGNLNMNQQASTGASATANQTGTVYTQAVTGNFGDAWTRIEAGDTSNNRQVYAETKARRTLSGSPTITVSSTALGSLGNTTAYESKQRSGGGGSTTNVYARNSGGTSTDSSASGSTTAWAWATLVNRYANV
jgi:hypothetical protein